MVEIQVKGDAFRRKCLQALDLWAKLRPQEAAAHVRRCKAIRETKTEDGDIKPSMSMPEFPVRLLRQSEFYTQMLYGSPCGTGDNNWDSRQDLQDIFMSCMPESMLSHRQGAPAKRGAV